MGLGGFSPLNLLRGPAYDVRGKTVLITGAGQGIGLALAQILYHRGASVALVDVDVAAAGRAATALGERAYSIAADVADRADMARAIDEAVRRFGRLDVVVANAGVTPRPATLRTLDPDEFDRVMNINLHGVFNTVRPALDHVVDAKGHVVVVSSCAAFAPGMGGSPYMVSKAGVEQLGRALRVELAAVGATAGVAYFGVVQTDMTRNMLDENDLGRELDGYLPWPLNVRITSEDAARTLADGIADRAARTIAPVGWEPYALLRGAVNVVLDSKLANDTGLHRLIRELEKRG